MTSHTNNGANERALILIEYINDWLAPSGGIHAHFRDREQFNTANANSKTIRAEARRRGKEVIHASLRFEPASKVLGDRQGSIQ